MSECVFILLKSPKSEIVHDSDYYLCFGGSLEGTFGTYELQEFLIKFSR